MTQGFASLNGVALTVINSQQRLLGSPFFGTIRRGSRGKIRKTDSGQGRIGRQRRSQYRRCLGPLRVSGARSGKRLRALRGERTLMGGIMRSDSDIKRDVEDELR